jgi:hypothetical protein
MSLEFNNYIENVNNTQNIENIEEKEFLSREDYIDEYKLDHKIFRFKFTDEFMEDLYKFSKIHQYDHRKEFKEAWLIWIDENAELVSDEIERLMRLNYEGDVIDKMFKSARYYFRKKSTAPVVSKQRRQYISISHNVLEAMDRHIKETVNNPDYQPKNGFISFCKANQGILKECIEKIMEQGIKDGELIETKLKKTYKNRYFMLITK